MQDTYSLAEPHSEAGPARQQGTAVLILNLAAVYSSKDGVHAPPYATLAMPLSGGHDPSGKL